MTTQPGWNWEGKGLRIGDRAGHIVAIVFDEGDAYLRVPRWVVRLVAWGAKWL